MKNKPTESITRIANQHKTSKTYAKYMVRVSEGKLTRDENPLTHFCVYFAAYDPIQKEVFIGHHKKSNLWLFNGGHIDKDETPEEALAREIGEEWGLDINSLTIGESKLLTITEINNPTKQTCTKHYDIWYFVSVSKSNFKPDSEKLAKEFHETRWVNPDEAVKLVTDSNTIEAISEIEKKFESKNKRVLPTIIKEVGFDFSWDEPKVWALDIPVEEIDMSELEWHFDIPFWWTEGNYYDFKPIWAIQEPEKYPDRVKRIMAADLQYPLDIMQWKGRWLLLDGLHRLAKAKMLGNKTVRVRKIPQEAIPKIKK